MSSTNTNNDMVKQTAPFSRDETNASLISSSEDVNHESCKSESEDEKTDSKKHHKARRSTNKDYSRVPFEKQDKNVTLVTGFQGSPYSTSTRAAYSSEFPMTSTNTNMGLIKHPTPFNRDEATASLISSSDDVNREICKIEPDDEKAESTTQHDCGRTTYRDYSRVPHEKQDKSESIASQLTTGKDPTFPVKLHLILSNPAFQDIIAWLPHGRSWRILQQKAFEERVVPLYFRHGRYSSFARQVNGWGFRRITHGSDYNSYYHELFLRGLPHLCDKMRRLTAKDALSRKKFEDEPAPDFYAMSRENPLPEVSQLVPPQRASNTLPSTVVGSGQSLPATTLADVELAILEKRRSDILERIKGVTRNDPIGAAVQTKQDFGSYEPPATQNQFSLAPASSQLKVQDIAGVLAQLLNQHMPSSLPNPLGGPPGGSQGQIGSNPQLLGSTGTANGDGLHSIKALLQQAGLLQSQAPAPQQASLLQSLPAPTQSLDVLRLLNAIRGPAPAAPAPPAPPLAIASAPNNAVLSQLLRQIIPPQGQQAPSSLAQAVSVTPGVSGPTGSNGSPASHQALLQLLGVGLNARTIQPDVTESSNRVNNSLAALLALNNMGFGGLGALTSPKNN